MERWTRSSWRVVGLAAVLAAASLAALVAGRGGSGDSGAPDVVSIEKAPDYQDATLLAQAWKLPVAAAYRARFASQHNGSLCGMASTVNVLQSLGEAPPAQKALVIGTWSPLIGMQLGGVTLDELSAIMARATRRKVEVLRDLSQGHFRAYLPLTNDPTQRYTINFTRRPLFGRGGGHHSPIGGYLAEHDLVFVLDTNAEYKPFLVKADRLFEAMDSVDSSSGKKRGLLRLEARAATSL
jgi:Phytochelatin synthase